MDNSSYWSFIAALVANFVTLICAVVGAFATIRAAKIQAGDKEAEAPSAKSNRLLFFVPIIGVCITLAIFLMIWINPPKPNPECIVTYIGTETERIFNGMEICKDAIEDDLRFNSERLNVDKMYTGPSTTLKCNTSGSYLITANLTVHNATKDKGMIIIKIFKNRDEKPVAVEAQQVESGKLLVASLAGIVPLAKDDTVRVQISKGVDGINKTESLRIVTNPSPPLVTMTKMP